MTVEQPRYSELVYEAYGDLLEWLAERDGTPAEAQREVYGTPAQRRDAGRRRRGRAVRIRLVSDRCSTCGSRQTLRRNGALRRHLQGSRVCPGSGDVS